MRAGSKLTLKRLRRALRDRGCKQVRTGRHEVWATPGGTNFPVAAHPHTAKGTVRHSVLYNINTVLADAGLAAVTVLGRTLPKSARVA